ncbi:MAG TPA: STAS domain-containing protein [Anaerolineaceae bacterium]|nr:STAS domain-containing protein [Anaerolineaceae bacterium]
MFQSKATIMVRKANELVSVLDVKGEINAFAENSLMDAYSIAVANGTKIILLNFSGLEYMNSSGIGLLVTLLIRARRQNQRLMAYGLSSHYRQIFELTRLNEAIAVYSSEDEAMASMGVLA